MGNNDMMQCVTKSKSLFAPKLEKIQKKSYILAKKENNSKCS
jgi:hypothetical protein